MSRHKKYLIGGIVFKTEIVIPELPETELDHDTIIEIGKAPEELQNGYNVRALLQVNDKDEVLVIMPDLARFYIKGSKKVIIQILNKSRERDAINHLLTFIFGAISYKKHFFPLHGGGVVYNGEAYLFTGESGSGKSTTIAGLLKQEFPIVADDISNLFYKDGKWRVHPCFPRVKLWEDSLNLLSFSNRGEYRFKKDFNKYFVPVENSFIDKAYPVKRIYHLSTCRESTVSFNKLEGPDSIYTLRNNSFKPVMVKHFGLSEIHFNQLLSLSKDVQVYNLIRSKEKNEFGKMITELSNHIKNE